MVEVDVFWSYAIGAGFAAAAARQIKNEPTTSQNPYFLKNLLYLSLLFAPSGIVLLWAFCGWETMYVWNRETLPVWLVPVFCITNVTQGILGFWVTHKLVKANKLFWANMQWVFGYMAMFFILVHGWDGTGYRRFFTYNPTQRVGWIITGQEADALAHGFGPIAALKWMFSPVALTLYAMGVIMLPVLFRWIGKWAVEGYRLGDVDRELASKTTVGKVVALCCRLVFLDTLGSVILWSVLIHLFGWVIGCVIFIPLFAYFGLGPSGLIRKDIARMTLEPPAGIAPSGATGVTAAART